MEVDPRLWTFPLSLLVVGDVVCDVVGDVDGREVVLFFYQNVLFLSIIVIQGMCLLWGGSFYSFIFWLMMLFIKLMGISI